MALTMMTMAGIAGSIVLFEGLAALMESIVGDPEQDVTMALRRLASKNQRRAMSQLASEQRFQETMDERLAPINSATSRALTSAAMNQAPGGFVQESEPSMIDSIEKRLGLQSGHLARVSSPQRMGDMSSIYHQAGLPTPQSQSGQSAPTASGPVQPGSPQ